MKTLFAAICLLTLSFAISAQTKVVPIVEMKVRGLLGGIENGKFLDAKTTAAKLKGGENYMLYGVEGVNEGELKFDKPKNDQDVCDDFYYITFEDAEAVSGVALGDGYRWNPMPRTPKSISLNDATYKKIVADVLRTKGIAKTTIKLTQAVRIDLEGDGKEEVLIAATFYDGGLTAGAKRNDYSFILLRKIVAGKVQNIVVAGDFITKNIEFGAPNEYAISAIADLNGDGKMEMILHSAYYEGSGSWVMEMKGNKPVEIKALTVGCGV
jgi:hypothetical protein